ncbi:MAG: Two-component system sensor histidine kinase, partial [Bacteroidetes bacterium]|nr:Two-component system sensor histidine kinase [Bacteroidota bacterium]
MKKKKYQRLFLFFLLLPAFGFSQETREIDSLLTILRSTSYDTTRVDICNKISQLYCSVDFNKALSYNDQAISLAEKTNLPRRLAGAYNIRGIIYINLGRLKEADSSFNKAIELHIKNGNKKGLASGYGNLGAMYYMIGSYYKAMQFHMKCLKINEELRDKNGVAITLMNIANIHFIQKNYREAKKYYSSCRAIHHELHNVHEELTAMNNIAATLLDEGKAAEALSYFDSIKKIAGTKPAEFTVEYAFGLNGMGNCYRNLGDYKKSHFCLETAAGIYEQLNNTFKILEVTGNLAALYVKEKNYSKAIEFSNRYLEKAKAMEARQHEMDANEFLFKSYAGLNDYENAFRYHQQFTLLKDSILNSENVKNLNEIETKYETEKKESENKLLLQENQIQQLQIGRGYYVMAGISTLLLLVIVIAFLFIRQGRLNAQQRTLQLEQKLLRSQMNPHFIFNSLIAIESYIYKNEPKEAGKYLSGFARLMRLILENSREEYIPLSKEIKTLEYYLQLQKNRFDNAFDYAIELSEGTDPEAIAIPPMLAQPFIENSIEHGIKNNGTKGSISIRFSLSGN